jgi:hypothetical protein
MTLWDHPLLLISSLLSASLFGAFVMIEEEFRTRAYYAGAFALPSLQIRPSATAFGTPNRQKQAIFYTQEVGVWTIGHLVP